MEGERKRGSGDHDGDRDGDGGGGRGERIACARHSESSSVFPREKKEKPHPTPPPSEDWNDYTKCRRAHTFWSVTTNRERQRQNIRSVTKSRETCLRLDTLVLPAAVQGGSGQPGHAGRSGHVLRPLPGRARPCRTLPHLKSSGQHELCWPESPGMCCAIDKKFWQNLPLKWMENQPHSDRNFNTNIKEFLKILVAVFCTWVFTS